MKFERIKPVEQRLIDRGDHGPAGEQADEGGRAALFSATSGQGRDPSALVGVACDRCSEASALDLGGLLRAVFPMVVVVPWRSHPVFALCPACHHRSWLRPVTPDR